MTEDLGRKTSLTWTIAGLIGLAVFAGTFFLPDQLRYRDQLTDCVVGAWAIGMGTFIRTHVPGMKAMFKLRAPPEHHVRIDELPFSFIGLFMTFVGSLFVLSGVIRLLTSAS